MWLWTVAPCTSFTGHQLTSVFLKLKLNLRGCHFQSNSEVICAVKEHLEAQYVTFFCKGIVKLEHGCKSAPNLKKIKLKNYARTVFFDVFWVRPRTFCSTRIDLNWRIRVRVHVAALDATHFKSELCCNCMMAMVQQSMFHLVMAKLQQILTNWECQIGVQSIRWRIHKREVF